MAKEKSAEFKNIVKLMYMAGINIHQIAKDKCTNQKIITEILIEKRVFIKKAGSSEILGSKCEPYYKNEKEQMKLPTYNIKDLKYMEKSIYESRKDK